MTASGRLFALFARLPLLGSVKTRLTPRFSQEEALALHVALLADSLGLLRRGAEAAGADCRLYLSEAGELQESLASRLGPCDMRIQRGGDLGERLHQAFQEELGSSPARMVVIGSDSPHLPVSWVRRAFDELDRHDLVLGPARDGGYYLLGATRVHPFLFSGIPWGTAQVYRETVRRARREGIGIASLPALDDVDHPESIDRLYRELTRRRQEGDAEVPESTMRLFEQWAEAGMLRPSGP